MVYVPFLMDWLGLLTVRVFQTGAAWPKSHVRCRLRLRQSVGTDRWRPVPAGYQRQPLRRLVAIHWQRALPFILLLEILQVGWYMLLL